MIGPTSMSIASSSSTSARISPRSRARSSSVRTIAPRGSTSFSEKIACSSGSRPDLEQQARHEQRRVRLAATAAAPRRPTA